jgi:leucyl aminopeptidase
MSSLSDNSNPMPADALPTFQLAADTAAIQAELLVLPLFEGSTPSAGAPDVDSASGGALSRAFASREITGAPFEQWWPAAVTGWRASRVLGLGAGPRERWSPEMARRLASAAALIARQRRITDVAIVVPSSDGSTTARLAQAVAEGVILAQHETGHLKSTPADLPQVRRAWVIVADTGEARRALEASIERGRVLAECTNLARALGNEPANVLTPRELARRAQAAAEGTTLSVTVLDEPEIRARGMGLLLGVAQGSAEPPRVIVLEHNPSGAPTGPVLGLVGKGITFDTGGISIKPADGMERMKVDMAGGAAVIAALRAAALLEAPIRVIGVVPTTENMPGGRALKPGDVIRGASGKTVEVINTDAEGRLILGDGLWQARQLGATHLVDVATLTGACVVALGRVMAGLFGGPTAFIEGVRAVGEQTGDRCWPMPSADEYFEQLKSEVADMTNTGGRPAGAVTAAVFLKQFAGGLPWAHVDIAGVAWADEARPYQVKGATGAATRLLAELALDPAAWQ